MKPTLRVQDYTKQEREAVWYHHNEVSWNKKEAKKLIQDDRYFIERFGGSHSSQKETRRLSRKAVLMEQHRQTSMGDYDPDYIACLYRTECLPSIKHARRIGEQDAVIPQ